MMSKIINSEDVSECLLSTDLSFEGKKYKELSDETLKKWICDYYTHSDKARCKNSQILKINHIIRSVL